MGIALPEEILFKGGWPELHANPGLDPIGYLEDYIRSFIEKDIALTSGVQKIGEFVLALKLLAGRSAQLLNVSEVGAQAGVKGSTLQDWIFLLERNAILHQVRPFHSNLNKRLIKTPKLYFLDTGLATRLQGWRERDPLLRSPQAGPLFETLVYGELIRIRDHDRVGMDIYFWRTKEGEEIDFVVRLETRLGTRWIALESKLAAQAVASLSVPSAAKKDLPDLQELRIVTIGGERRRLGRHCLQIPISELRDEILGEVRGQLV